jgi:hypothetical protein
MKLDVSRLYGNTHKYGEKIMEEAEKYLFTTKKGIDVFMFIEPMSGICSYAKLFHINDFGKQNLLFKASYDLIWEADGTCRIFIGDIQMSQLNVSNGYGTILMDYILWLAKKNKATSISGLLGATELLNPENKIRLLSFYAKYNFQIKLNEEQNAGEIYLGLAVDFPRNTSHI